MLEELKSRYPAFRDGLPKILICSDSGTLPTGLARVVRGIFTELHNSNSFAIVQHGWFHSKNQTETVPWPIIPVRRDPANDSFAAKEDRMGQQSFDHVVEAIKPDIVFAVGDFHMFKHITDSKLRSSFQLVLYMPLDAFPPPNAWLEAARKPDKMVFYTNFAKSWASCLGVKGEFIPHGVDTTKFFPLDDLARKASRKRLFAIDPNDTDSIVIGTVGRVQPRKRLPIFIEVLAHVRAGGYSKCNGCQQISLHQFDPFDRSYTSFSDNQTCPRCNGSYGWSHGHAWPKLKCYLHADPRENQTIPIDSIASYWNLKDTKALLWNPSIRIHENTGVPDSNLIDIYQCLDLYMHCASGGGAELPLLESAACGVPIICADAPAHNEYAAAFGGAKLVRGDVQWDHTAAGYRVFSTTSDMAAALINFLELSPEEKALMGQKNREDSLQYDWSSIALNQWLPLFREVLDPATRIEGWRVMQEV